MNPSRALLPHIRRRWQQRGAIATVAPRPNINGIYLGFSPTDESALVCGEFMMEVTASDISITFATGLTVYRERTKRRYWRILTAEEVKAHFNKGATDIDDAWGMTYAESGVTILFLRDVPDTASVCLIGLFGYEVFGPTMLFTPEQVRQGAFERAVEFLEDENDMVGQLPRIHLGGVAAA